MRRFSHPRHHYDTMIEINGLTKHYGRHTVVDNLSFRCESGEVLGFLGPADD